MIGFFRPDGTAIGEVVQDGASSVSYNNASDRRLKDNISPTEYALQDLMKVEVTDFTYRSDPEKKLITGFIAQDLYKVFPNAVTVGGDDVSTDPWGVDYSKLTPLLVKALQDLSELVEQQQQDMDELKMQLSNLLKD